MAGIIGNSCLLQAQIANLIKNIRSIITSLYFDAKIYFRDYDKHMAGYFVYQSCRIDTFVNEYPNLFRQENFLTIPTYYVVKNNEMGEWLKRHLANRFGAVLGLRVLEVDQAIREFSDWYASSDSHRRVIREDRRDLYSNSKTITAVDKSTAKEADTANKVLLSRSEMKLVIYKALEEFLKEEAASFKTIRAYLAKAPQGEESEWLWYLAGSVADAFIFYDSNLSGQWEDSAWQLLLWKRIFRAGLSYSSPGSRLSEIVTSERVSKEDSVRIVILLPGLLGEQVLRFIRHMGREHEVHHLLIMPIWSREPTRAFVFNNSRSARHMALLCGRLGAAKFETIPAKGKDGATVLERLRKSLRDDEPVRGALLDDGSLGIHSVCGPRREIEVLKKLILTALREDDTLAPAEIAVLAPDISSYAPYIETVFPSVESRKRGDHLEYELMDMPARVLAPYPMAFKTLASLPGSRFGRHTLLSLFDNPCFAPTAGQSELASEWKDIVRELHVRWGSTVEHRREEDAFDLETGTWESAFERLLAAYYHEEDDSSDLIPARYFSDTDTQSAGKLIYVIRTLDVQLRQLHKKALPLEEWADCWLKVTEDWLVAQPGSGDELSIRRGLEKLIELSKRLNGFSDFSNRTIPWPVFSVLLDELCFPSNIHHSYSSGRGVVCASIRNLRCIPFRRIYMLGMNEGAWPPRRVLPGFDFRNIMEDYENLSREAEDRLCFLEVLFSAGDNASLLYTGRDSEFGTRLSPAAPIVELMEHLGEGAQALLRSHPLAPYHPSCLRPFEKINRTEFLGGAIGEDEKARISEGESEIDSFFPRHLTLARSLHEEKGRTEPPSAILPLPARESDSIDWQVLAKFLRNPVEHFYRERMEVAWPEMPNDLDEYDVLEPNHLKWWSWCRNAVLENPEILSSAAELVDGFRNYIRREGSVSNSTVSELQAEQWLEESELLISSLEDLKSKELELGLPFRCRFLPEIDYPHRTDQLVTETDRKIKPVPGEELLLPAPRVEGERVLRIAGLIEGLRLPSEESDGSVWTMLEFASARKLGSKNNLRTWIAALMISDALGSKGPRELRVFYLGRGEKRLRRYFFETHSSANEQDSILMMNSKEMLRVLLEVFWAGQKAPLPLYPDLADEIAKLSRKRPNAVEENGDVERKGLFLRFAEKAWNELVTSNWGTNVVQSCYYRKNFLGSPDFTSRAFFRGWEELYFKGGLLPREDRNFRDASSLLGI